MIHPFIFKTVAAEHKARLQSAEHESKERRWCWHLVYSQGNNSPQVLYKISETSYKTKKRAFILAEIIRICKGEGGEDMQNYCNCEFTGYGPSTVCILSNNTICYFYFHFQGDKDHFRAGKIN